MSAPERTVDPDDVPQQGWSAFVASPLHSVHRARLQVCFDNLELPAATLDAMLAQPRLRERLTRMLEQRFGLQPLDAIEPPQAADVPVATLGAPHLSELARRCGVVFWAHAFVREIRAPAVRALRERFGDALFDLALAEHTLACPVAAHEMPTTLDTLAAAVARDGQACVNAWLAEQPRALAAWYRLKADEPAGAAPVTARIEHYGPPIVRRVVQLNVPAQGVLDD